MAATLADAAPANRLKALLDRYRRHSPVTDPGRHGRCLEALPTNVPELVEVIGGVFAHYEFDLPGTGFAMPAERRGEPDLRFAGRILDRILALGVGTLERPRPIEARYLGVCRDAGVLLISILRAQGVPARLRYGMTRHLYDARRPFHDHVLVEYWSRADGCWKFADPRAYQSVREANGIPDEYRADVPGSEFLTGREAWRAAREDDAAAFRLSGLTMNADAGLCRSRNLFLYDLASLAGWEPLMWDAWGYMLRRRHDARPRGVLQFRRLDALAALDPRDPAQCAELLARSYRMRGLRVPSKVVCCSPLSGRSIVRTGMA
jgi:hypothetical protein